MKLLKIFYPLILLIPMIGISCTLKDNSNYFLDEENKNPVNQKLTFENYFEKSIPTDAKSAIKKRITNIINKYRLWEWNNYYAKSQNVLQKSKVLNIDFLDYKEITNNNLLQNDIFKKEDVEWTAIYENQDLQFRYFNDFINIINEENQKNQEDFLYLRWLYYSIEAAKKYKNIKYEEKHIYEINLQDWIMAIEAFIPKPVPEDPKKLPNLITKFINYYGGDIDPDIIASLINEKFFPNNQNKIEKEISINVISLNIYHTFLCAKDLVMRFSSKEEKEINRYSLWKSKALRIAEVYELSKEKFNLLSNSFISQEDDDIENEQIKSILNFVQELVMEILNTFIQPLVKVEINEYANSNEIIKGGID